MINGRHLLLLGLIACAGLISVHDGQIQTDLCYQIAAREKQLRDVRDRIELDRIKHTALQSPAAVMSRAAALNLRVLPPAFSAVPEVALPDVPAALPASRSPEAQHGARKAPAAMGTRAIHASAHVH